MLVMVVRMSTPKMVPTKRPSATEQADAANHDGGDCIQLIALARAGLGRGGPSTYQNAGNASAEAGDDVGREYRAADGYAG